MQIFDSSLGSKKQRTISIVCLVILSLVLLLAASYVGRGLLRSKVLPDYYSFRYRRSLDAALTDAVRSANATVGTGAQLAFMPAKPSGCMLDYAKGIHTSIWCGGEVDAHKQYGDDPQVVMAAIAANEEQLKKMHWEGGKQNWEAAPDSPVAYLYAKKYGDIHCAIEIVVTMRHEIDGRTFCYKNYTFLGDPLMR